MHYLWHNSIHWDTAIAKGFVEKEFSFIEVNIGEVKRIKGEKMFGIKGITEPHPSRRIKSFTDIPFIIEHRCMTKACRNLSFSDNLASGY